MSSQLASGIEGSMHSFHLLRVNIFTEKSSSIHIYIILLNLFISN